MFLNILTFFKEFLKTEDDFQQNFSPPMVDIDSKLFSLGLTSRNVYFREDQT